MKIKSTEHPEYNAEDLQGYHRGKLDAQEMHELEKAALTDPFLSDALEGFSYESKYNRTHLLTSIQNQFHRRTSLSKSIKYLSIAASFLLIIISTWILSKNELPEDNSMVLKITKENSEVSAQPNSTKTSTADGQKSEKEVPILAQKKRINENREEIALAEIPEQVAPKMVELQNTDVMPSDEFLQTNQVNDRIKKEELSSIANQALEKRQESALLKASTPIKRTQSSLPFNNKLRIIPETGWKDFETYMKNGLTDISWTDMDKKQPFYKVRFHLNNERKPIHINFPYSPTPPERLKTAIIDLLKKGPGWLGKTSDEETYEISIELP